MLFENNIGNIHIEAVKTIKILAMNDRPRLPPMRWPRSTAS
jgi:hypothetical protein